MKFNEERRAIIKAHALKRSEKGGLALVKAVVRLEGVHEGDVKHRIKTEGFEFFSDEPPERGGTNSGPGPLSYFMGGALACLMNQYVRVAAIEDLDIEDFTANARAHFEMKVGGSFTDIFYDIHIKSKEGADKIRGLSKKAEDYCYVHNTLLRAVTVKTNIYLNEKLL